MTIRPTYSICVWQRTDGKWRQQTSVMNGSQQTRWDHLSNCVHCTIVQDDINKDQATLGYIVRYSLNGKVVTFVRNKLLRIVVDGEGLTVIVRKIIFSFGIRNIFRCSVDDFHFNKNTYVFHYIFSTVNAFWTILTGNIDCSYATRKCVSSR